VLDLDLYNYTWTYNKWNGCMEYKEMDQTLKLVYNLARIKNHGYY
jgi:hypothetical protein